MSAFGIVFLLATATCVLGACVAVVTVYFEQKREERKKALELQKFEALEEPELIELGGPKKALPGDAVADPFRGVE